MRKLPKLPPLDAVADKVLAYRPMPKSCDGIEWVKVPA